MSDKGYLISKTSFLKFEQCHKAFFLYKNHPYLRDKLSIDKKITFKRGHDVGYFAQQIFPNGIDVSLQKKNAMAALELTSQLIQNKTQIIYEATFLFDGVLIMVDILCLKDNKYTCYEVKSSIKVSEVYIKDACLQYYVLKNSLPDFEDLFLVTLNPNYVLEDKIEPKKLFKKRSIKLKAEANFLYFTTQIKAAKNILEQNSIPNISIGKQCFKPYACDFMGICWKDTINEKSIFNLPQIDKTKLFEWFNQGFKSLDQVPEQFIESKQLLKVKHSLITDEPIVEFDKIKQFLLKIKQPAAAMDMEVWSPAIPEIKGTRPFQQIPFLVCFYNHNVNTNFFVNHKKDERKLFAKKLIELSTEYATVFVYDKSMEVAVIDNLIERYSEFEIRLTELKNKLIDVFDVFLSLDYYHPEFKTNFTLKKVASVLLKDISYSNIKSGLEAMQCYQAFRNSQSKKEKNKLKKELIIYCDTDCLSTYNLVYFLERLIKTK